MDKDFIIKVLEDFFEVKGFNYLYGPNSDYNDEMIVTEDCGNGVYEYFTDGEREFEGHSYKIELGASKMVFIFDDFDEVIKLPLSGEWYFDYDEDDEDEEEFDDDKEYGYVYTEWQHDYLEEEREIYKEASDDLKQILADNIFVCQYGGVNVYTQKKVEKTYSDVRAEKSKWEEISEDTRKKAETSHNKRPALPASRFLADIIDMCKNGEKIIEEIDFDDLHNSNYGYDKNGLPIIFDYGGFLD